MSRRLGVALGGSACLAASLLAHPRPDGVGLDLEARGRLGALTRGHPALREALERGAFRVLSLPEGGRGVLVFPPWRPPLLARLTPEGDGIGPAPDAPRLGARLDVRYGPDRPGYAVASCALELGPEGGADWPARSILWIPPDALPAGEVTGPVELALLDESGVVVASRREGAFGDEPCRVRWRRWLSLEDPGPYEWTQELPLALAGLRAGRTTLALAAEGLPFRRAGPAGLLRDPAEVAGLALLPAAPARLPGDALEVHAVGAPDEAPAAAARAGALARALGLDGGSLDLLEAGDAPRGDGLRDRAWLRAAPGPQRARWMAHLLGHRLVDDPGPAPGPDALPEALASALGLLALDAVAPEEARAWRRALREAAARDARGTATASLVADPDAGRGPAFHRDTDAPLGHPLPTLALARALGGLPGEARAALLDAVRERTGAGLAIEPFLAEASGRVPDALLDGLREALTRPPTPARLAAFPDTLDP